MYGIAYAQSARRALKKLRRSGRFPESAFVTVLETFLAGKSLPTSFRDHALSGDMVPARECHLGFGLLVVYKCNEEKRIVTITEVGTHQNIFGE